MPPWKTPQERVAWLLSQRGHGRVPYDYTGRTASLIEHYNIQRVTPSYNKATADKVLYIVSWRGGAGNEIKLRMSHADIVHWIVNTDGKRSPLDEYSENFLSVPEIADIYGIPQNRVRDDLYSMTDDMKLKHTYKDERGYWMVSRYFVNLRYGERSNVNQRGAQGRVNLDAFERWTDDFVPLIETPTFYAVKLNTVKNYFYRNTYKLIKRGLVYYADVEKGKPPPWISCDLCFVMWGKK